MPVSLFTHGVEPDDPDAEIWRFVDLKKLADLLTGQLYFRRSDLFDDASEALPPEDYERVLQLSPYDLGDIRKRNDAIGFIAQMRQSFYVNCWYLFKEETAAMWKTYGGNGVAVRSTYSRLKAVLNTLPDDANLGLIRYGTEHIDRWNLMIFASTKQKQYAHEREVRAMLWIRDGHESGNRHIDIDNNVRDRPVYETENPTGVKRPIDFKTLVTGIVVSPYASELLVREVTALVERSQNSFPVTPSELTRFAALLP